MNKYTKELHTAHIAAWREGKLEFSTTGEWGPAMLHPDCDSNPDYYRIRPERRLRPWKPEELPVGAVFLNSGGNLLHPVAVSPEVGVVRFVGFNNAFEYSLKEMFDEKWKYSIDPVGTPHNKRTWSPCGVEEEV